MADEPYGYLDQPPQVGSYAAMTYGLNPAEKKKLAAKKRRGIGFKIRGKK